MRFQIEKEIFVLLKLPSLMIRTKKDYPQIWKSCVTQLEKCSANVMVSGSSCSNWENFRLLKKSSVDGLVLNFNLVNVNMFYNKTVWSLFSSARKLIHNCEVMSGFSYRVWYLHGFKTHTHTHTRTHTHSLSLKWGDLKT